MGTLGSRTGPRPSSNAELADRLARWLYMNTTTSQKAAAVAGPLLVQALDNIGVLDMAGPVALPDSVPTPEGFTEAHAVMDDFRALDRAASVLARHRLVGMAEDVRTLASLYRDAHNAWAAGQRAAARQRMGLPPTEGGEG